MFIVTHQLSTFLLNGIVSTRLNVLLLKILSIPFSVLDGESIFLGGPTKIFPFLFSPSLNQFHLISSFHAELCTLTVNSCHPSSTLFVLISTSKTRYISSLLPNKISSLFSVKFTPDHVLLFILLQ